MAWSYSGDPAASTLDQVRFLCGDTDTTNQLLQNAEITFLISQWTPNAYYAAAFACEAIAGKYQGKADYSRSVGDLSISTQFGASAKGFLDRAERLRSSSAHIAPPSPNWDADGYPVSSEFSIGMGRNVGSGMFYVPPIQDFPE